MIDCEVRGAVRVIRIGSPPAGILSSGGAKTLLRLFEEAIRDPATRAVIFTGRDAGIFIRHYDLASIGKAGRALKDGVIGPETFLDAEFARLTDLVAGCDIPVIAAINGICMGGGLELALACDVRIAQRDVVHIGLPEIRADILPGGGGTIRLARLIGESAALDIALRGRTLTAERAWQLGIVNDLADDALAAALVVAQAMAERDPAALTAIKRLARGAFDMPLTEGLKQERLAFAHHLASSDRALETMERLLAEGTMLEDAPGGESAR